MPADALTGRITDIGVVTGSITGSVQHYLLHLHHPLVVYAVVAGLVFAEVGIVVGLFVPGEITAVIGGVLAADHQVNVVAMGAVVVAAAVVGNGTGYLLGGWVGPWLLRHRPLAGNRHVARAQALIDRRGGPAVLIGRFLAVVRALVPAVSGIAGMPVATFAVFSAVGGVLWGGLWVGIGYAVGNAYAAVLDQAQRWTEVILVVGVVVAVAAFVIVRLRTRRRQRVDDRPQPTPDGGEAA